MNDVQILVLQVQKCQVTMGGNPTPVRGILEKIQPEHLQNLPEGVERVKNFIVHFDEHTTLKIYDGILGKKFLECINFVRNPGYDL